MKAFRSALVEVARKSFQRPKLSRRFAVVRPRCRSQTLAHKCAVLNVRVCGNRARSSSSPRHLGLSYLIIQKAFPPQTPTTTTFVRNNDFIVRIMEATPRDHPHISIAFYTARVYEVSNPPRLRLIFVTAFACQRHYTQFSRALAFVGDQPPAPLARQMMAQTKSHQHVRE